MPRSSGLTNIKLATKQYEEWLGKQTKLVDADLKYKHQQMKIGVFPFLRSTFYRWAEAWPVICSDLTEAPTLLSVGDLHVENFGTWRDGEGRLIWGVNDFDEACELPYTSDLLRLATSAGLSIQKSKLKISLEETCEIILHSYDTALKSGGVPYVLGEEHSWLFTIANTSLREPVNFWSKLKKLRTIKTQLTDSADKSLKEMFPTQNLQYRVVPRRSGLGSLGRQRYVAIIDWFGGSIAREVKAFVPSAATWANKLEKIPKHPYEKIVSNAVRCPDPFLRVSSEWIGRRLAPDCSRVELGTLPKASEARKLLYAMGVETANIHLGSQHAIKAVRTDMKSRDSDWLYKSARIMMKQTRADWEDWRQ